MKPYDVPHKGLRNALSQLSLLAGKTDYSKLEEVAQLRLLGDAVFKILTIHASDEKPELQNSALEGNEQREPRGLSHEEEEELLDYEFDLQRRF